MTTKIQKLRDEVIDACLRKLTNNQARNLMEHAANKTPVIQGDDICYVWARGPAG